MLTAVETVVVVVTLALSIDTLSVERAKVGAWSDTCARDTVSDIVDAV